MRQDVLPKKPELASHSLAHSHCSVPGASRHFSHRARPLEGSQERKEAELWSQSDSFRPGLRGDTIILGPYKGQIAKRPEQWPRGKVLVSREDIQGQRYRTTSEERQCHSWAVFPPPSSWMAGVPVPMEVPVPRQGTVAVTERVGIFPPGYYF